jgi:hypothetical protein
MLPVPIELPFLARLAIKRWSVDPTLIAVEVAIIRITIIRDIWRQPKGNICKYDMSQ